ncbi:hypothetical protein [Actinomadura violacea]|uniref:Uncharacterized protein n=1 Tax=Actinomadura violacea TaxID=2819934 RepID=A0ABS3RXJ3_9ACTN|nr:hypothetical protein [Actinomadura violacea]MBO2461482.1 hypothetical protein [Actinomadura violacea]
MDLPGTDLDSYVARVVASESHHPDGTRTVVEAPAVWTLAHKGYSGSGRLDVWLYASEKAASKAGASLALACGLDEDGAAVKAHRARRYQKVLARYEELHPGNLLRVQSACFQTDDHGMLVFGEPEPQRT